MIAGAIRLASNALTNYTTAVVAAASLTITLSAVGSGNQIRLTCTTGGQMMYGVDVEFVMNQGSVVEA